MPRQVIMALSLPMGRRLHTITGRESFTAHPIRITIRISEVVTDGDLTIFGADHTTAVN
jgi:hypothetical protein